jgi:hypothetical protein
MPSITCERCGSARIKRSRTRGIREKFLKSVGYRAFRCREQSCRWRGLIKVKEVTLEDFIKKHKMALIFIISMFVALFLVVLLEILLDNFSNLVLSNIR